MNRTSTNLGRTYGLPKSNCSYCFINVLLKINAITAILLMRNLNNRKTYITVENLITCRKSWRLGLTPYHLGLWIAHLITCSYLCPSCLCEGNSIVTDQLQLLPVSWHRILYYTHHSRIFTPKNLTNSCTCFSFCFVFIFNYVYVCMSVSLQRPKEEVQDIGSGDIHYCEPLSVGAGNKIQVFWKSHGAVSPTTSLCLLTIQFSLGKFFLYASLLSRIYCKTQMLNLSTEFTCECSSPFFERRKLPRQWSDANPRYSALTSIYWWEFTQEFSSDMIRSEADALQWKSRAQRYGLAVINSAVQHHFLFSMGEEAKDAWSMTGRNLEWQ